MSDFINKNTFEIKISVHDPDYENQPDWFKCNDMDIPNCLGKYKKWNESENKVEEMTQAEKDVVDQAETDAIAQKIENSKNIDNLEKLTKALALVILGEINILRVKAGLSERTVSQLKTAVKNKYETL